MIELARASGGDLVAGIDMAFSLPAWYLRELGLAAASDLWALPEAQIEGWLAACEPPFWGRPGRARPPDALQRGFRLTDLEHLGRPQSPFQIGGSGAVGTGSLRGFRILDRLRREGFRIWPFDDPRRPVAVEIWPRLFMGRLNKSRLEQRLAFLRQRGWPAAAGVNDDAFDAAVSALSMSLRAAELARLPVERDPVRRLEGRIWPPDPAPGRPVRSG